MSSEIFMHFGLNIKKYSKGRLKNNLVAHLGKPTKVIIFSKLLPRYIIPMCKSRNTLDKLQIISLNNCFLLQLHQNAKLILCSVYMKNDNDRNDNKSKKSL